ncbi:MAG: GspH/FimT family pseudopilin [Gammaproteobacteria bacterium]|nr:GspH/FimT family pseudopilin [Gammaproteobacteria bacterium]
MKKERGLTLIELMVTLVIFILITSLAFPGFQLYKQNSNRVTQTNDLISALNLARSEAVQRNLNIAVCASVDLATCSEVNDWTTGWIMFIDDNQNGVADATDGNGLIDGGEATLLTRHGRLSGANLVYTDVDNGAVSVRFDSGGMPSVFNAAGAATTSATFMRCDDRRNTDALPNQHARAVLLTRTGRVRISNDNDDNGVHNGLTAELACP